MSADKVAYKIGDRVSVGGRIGKVVYLDQVDFKTDGSIWAGVHLDEPLGKNDGMVEGKRYFECPPNHGILVPHTKLEPPITKKAPRLPTVPPVVAPTRSSELRIEAGRRNADAASMRSGGTQFTTRTTASRMVPLSRPAPQSTNNAYVQQLTDRIRELTNMADCSSRKIELLFDENSLLKERLNIAAPKYAIEDNQNSLKAINGASETSNEDVEFILTERSAFLDELRRQNAELKETGPDTLSHSVEDQINEVITQRDGLKAQLATLQKDYEKLQQEQYISPLSADLVLPNDHSAEVKSLQTRLEEEVKKKAAAEETLKAVQSQLAELTEKSAQVDSLLKQIECFKEERADLLRKIEEAGEGSHEQCAASHAEESKKSATYATHLAEVQAKLDAAQTKIETLEAANAKLNEDLTNNYNQLKQKYDEECQKHEAEVQQSKNDADESAKLLQEARHDVAVKYEELENLKAAHVQECARLQAELAEKHQHHSSKVTELEEQLDAERRLREEIANKDTKIGLLQSNLDESKDSRDLLQYELDEAKVKIDTLTSELNSLRQNGANQAAETQAAVAKLEATCSELTEKLAVAQTNLDDERRQREEDAKKAAALQEKLDAASETVLAKTNEVEELSKQLDSLKATLTEREADFERQVSGVTTELDTLKAERDDLKQKFDEAAKAQEQLVGKAAEISKLEAVITDTKKSHDEECQALQKNLEDANARCEAVTAQIEEQRLKTAEELANGLQQLSLEKNAKETAESERAAVNQKLTAQQTELENATALVEQQKAELSELRRQINEGITANNEAAEKAVQKLSSDLQAAQEDVAKLSASVKDTQSKLDAASASIERLQKQRDTLEAERTRLEEENKNAVDKVAEAAGEAKRASDQYAEQQKHLEEKLANVSEQLSVEKSAKETSESERAAVNQKLTAQQTELENSVALVEQQKAELSELRRQINEGITANNEAAEKAVQKLSSDLQAAQEDVAKLSASVKDTQSKLDTASVNIEELQKQRDTVEAERTRLEEAVKTAEKNHAEEVSALKAETSHTIEVLTNTVKDAESRANTLEKELSELKGQVAGHSELTANHNQVQKQLAELQSAKEASDGLAKSLSDELSAVKEQVDAVSKSKAEIDAEQKKLQQQLKDATEQYEAAKKEHHAEIEKLQESMKTQLAEINTRHAAEVEALAAQKESNTAKTAEINARERALIEQLQSEKSAAEQQVKDLLDQLQSEKASAKQMVTELRAEIEKLNELLATERELTVASLKEKLDVERETTEHTLDELKAEHAKMRDNMKAYYEENVDQLKTRLVDVEKELAQERVARQEMENEFIEYTTASQQLKDKGVNPAAPLSNNQNDKLQSVMHARIQELEKKVEELSLYEHEATMQRTMIVELNKKIAFLNELAVNGEDVENNEPQIPEDDFNMSIPKVRLYCDNCEEFGHDTSECTQPTTS